MNAFDFNDAAPQRGEFELVPDNTVAIVVAKLRPGGHGPGGWLKNSKTGECLMLDFEFVVDGGPHDRSKFWDLFVTEGETEGQKKAAGITRSKLRAMLESARGVMPGDDSEGAMKKRHADGWGTFDGLRFCAVIGLEEAKGEYKAKNVLKAAVTPDESDYIPVGSGSGSAVSAPKAANAAGAKAGGSAKPAWAS